MYSLLSIWLIARVKKESGKPELAIAKETL